jgi:holo-[acyl-carrier protein] synthase
VNGGDRATSLGVLGRGVAEALGAARPGPVVGVGIDAVDLERFARVLARRPGMTARLFTEGELAYARAASDPVPRLSTRFAAKEAAMKALGVGLGAFPFHDVEVVRSGLDAPWLSLRGAAARLAAEAGIGSWFLSLTHTDHVAMAVVVAEGAAVGPTASAPPGQVRTSPSLTP